MGYAEDREWSDIWIPKICDIVGPLLLKPATFEWDTKEATDLRVLNARDMRIGCRMREEGTEQKYPGEFTIRSQRDSGHETELWKVICGWGDWLFYGIQFGDNIWPWRIIDLDAFRAHLIKNKNLNALLHSKANQKPNGDGTWFTFWKVSDFRGAPDILVRQSGESPIITVEAPF